MCSELTRDDAIREAQTHLHCAHKLLESATTDWGKRFFSGEVEKAEAELRAANLLDEVDGPEPAQMGSAA
jgi:hypothetical protein